MKNKKALMAAREYEITCRDIDRPRERAIAAAVEFIKSNLSVYESVLCDNRHCVVLEITLAHTFNFRTAPKAPCHTFNPTYQLDLTRDLAVQIEDIKRDVASLTQVFDGRATVIDKTEM